MHVDTEDELYQWFVKQVQVNLHIVFTINPANADFKTRSATSPALFNRCVIDWFGDWSQEALFQVADAFTTDLELVNLYHDTRGEEEARGAFVASIVKSHNIVTMISKKIEKQSGKRNFVTPRHYLDFIKHFRDLYEEKRQDLQEQQTHINKGLEVYTIIIIY
jgi:dynein heavy chain 1